MAHTEIEILMASQKEAARVLVDARAEADALLANASSAAAELLRSQHDDAERLLFEEAVLARETLDRASRDSQDRPTDEAERYMQEHDRRAAQLLEEQRSTAEALRETQEDEAASSESNVELRAADILMGAQREASAILLRGWMKVIEVRGDAPQA